MGGSVGNLMWKVMNCMWVGERDNNHEEKGLSWGKKKEIWRQFRRGYFYQADGLKKKSYLWIESGLYL